MTDCPCCSNPMLRHIQHHQTVWLCRHCWQEMPDLTTMNIDPLRSRRSLERAIQQPMAQPFAVLAIKANVPATQSSSAMKWVNGSI